MSKANLYGQDSAGNWVPLRVGATGLMVGQGGNSDGIPTGQPQTVSLWSYAGATGGITGDAAILEAGDTLGAAGAIALGEIWYSLIGSRMVVAAGEDLVRK